MIKVSRSCGVSRYLTGHVEPSSSLKSNSKMDTVMHTALWCH